MNAIVLGGIIHFLLAANPRETSLEERTVNYHLTSLNFGSCRKGKQNNNNSLLSGSQNAIWLLPSSHLAGGWAPESAQQVLAGGLMCKGMRLAIHNLSLMGRHQLGS